MGVDTNQNVGDLSFIAVLQPPKPPTTPTPLKKANFLQGLD